MNRSKQFNVLSMTILILFLGFESAGASVGQVLFVMGPASVEKPEQQFLRRGSFVDAGDVIVTTARSYVQIKLDDGTKIAVRPGSRFTIEAVEMPATATTPAIGAGTAIRASFSLQRGGFRTITGRIAKSNPIAYQVTTPSAVIRVRGTNYSARYCAADCGTAGSVVDDGLYVGVSDGGVSMSNNGGDLNLAVNQFGFARDFNTEPQRLLAPPGALSEEGLAIQLSEEEEEAAENDESTSEDEGTAEDADEIAEEFTGADEPTEVATRDGADAATQTGAATPDQQVTARGESGSAIDITGGRVLATPQGLAYAQPGLADSQTALASDLVFDASGGLIRFGVAGSTGQSNVYDLGTGANVNQGADPVTGLKWGRWTEGVGSLAVGNATSQLDLSVGSVHWVAATAETVPSQIISGSAEYILAGNTDPTDNLGNVGVLGTASLTADFTNARVASNVQLGIADQVWSATGTGAINARLFAGLYDTVTVNGSPGGNGTFAGAFTGFSPSGGAPLGAGMTYDLGNGSSSVNGAVVFNRNDNQ